MWINQKVMVVRTIGEPSSLTNTLCVHIRENVYNLYKPLSILVSMYLPQTNGVYVFSLGFKLVGTWKSYFMLENKCNQSDTHGWDVKLMLFNAMVTQVLFYGVEAHYLS